jgi:hypothetical protein
LRRGGPATGEPTNLRAGTLGGAAADGDRRAPLERGGAAEGSGAQVRKCAGCGTTIAQFLQIDMEAGALKCEHCDTGPTRPAGAAGAAADGARDAPLVCGDAAEGAGVQVHKCAFAGPPRRVLADATWKQAP